MLSTPVAGRVKLTVGVDVVDVALSKSAKGEAGSNFAHGGFFLQRLFLTSIKPRAVTRAMATAASARPSQWLLGVRRSLKRG